MGERKTGNTKILVFSLSCPHREVSQFSNWNLSITLPTAVGHICITTLKIEKFRFALLIGMHLES